MNLHQLFQIQFANRTAKTAIRFEDRTVTFGELEEQSNRVAFLLHDLGLRKGDRIAFYLGNCVEWVIAHLANLQSGLVTVPLNPQYREAEILHIVADSRPRVILTDCVGLSSLAPLRARLPGVEQIFLAESLQDVASRGQPLPPVVVDGEDPAAILYTSGTTGRSKGAVLSHNNFVSNTAGLALAWAWTSEDVLLLALPLFHTHGLGVALHGALATGCTTILHAGFKADRVMQTLEQDQVTLFMGVPTMYVRLLEFSEGRRPEWELAHMRLFVSGSAPLSEETFRRFEQVFGHPILERYGMTETIMNISNPCAGPRLPGTVGVPLPGVSVRIVREDGSAAPDGEIGELLLRGPNVFGGYWQAPEKTAESFCMDEEGRRWFRSGDLGLRDASTGYYRLAGRRHDLIICGGYNIYPREVEDLLSTHPAILEAAVVAKTDAALGEVAVAFVVLRPGSAIGGQELAEYCSSRMARYKVPRVFNIVDVLPRNAMGKVEKKKLICRQEAE